MNGDQIFQPGDRVCRVSAESRFGIPVGLAETPFGRVFCVLDCFYVEEVGMHGWTPVGTDLRIGTLNFRKVSEVGHPAISEREAATA